MICQIVHRTLLASLLYIILIAGTLHAQTITGKVVGVADGDTITVLQNRTQYKIRLHGIDTPEKGQDFGNRAKQFTSGMVFGKQVQVIQKDTDRYNRVVGVVYIGDKCLNQELIRNGFAWVYQKYCKDAVCNEWQGLESQARKSKIGLWSHADPIPPWDYRRGARASPALQIGGKYHGNVRSMVFHQEGCKHFNCKNCKAVFESRKEAVSTGYRPCGNCKP